jgi:hypothetical protein
MSGATTARAAAWTAAKDDKHYLYTETSDKSSGILIATSRVSGNSLLEQPTDLRQRAAMMLGLAPPKELSWIIGSKSNKLQLPTGVKLLENREAGAYLWNWENGNEHVDLQTRLPGWRFMLELPGQLNKPGFREEAKVPSGGLWEYLPADEPFIIVVQILYRGGEADGGIVIKTLLDSRIFAIACWAPSKFYPKYEALFERVLSEFRVYDFKRPKTASIREKG